MRKNGFYWVKGRYHWDIYWWMDDTWIIDGKKASKKELDRISEIDEKQIKRE